MISIGDLTIKNSDRGFSGISWVDMPELEDEDKYGRLPTIISVGIGDISEN